MQKYKQQRKNILSNVKSLQSLYGVDSDITIVIKDNIVVYGILNKNKTFYSRDNHKRFTTIALYQRSITISFLSNIASDLLSVMSE